MTSQNPFNDSGGPIPRPNVQALANSLRDGQMSVPTAIAQISSVVRESLKTIEDFAEEQARLNHERKMKLDKMDKIVSDLSEKCQGMQQALLYKEEKYDEKCREVERYKVICELSAKAAVSDNQYYQTEGEINNNPEHSYNEIYRSPDVNNSHIKAEPHQVDAPRLDNTSGQHKRNVKEHMKLNQSQLHLSQYVNPLRSDSPKSSHGGMVAFDDYEDSDRQSTGTVVPQYYAGGPCKRNKIPINNHSLSKSTDSRMKERMETIGGINIRGPMVNFGPVVRERLINNSSSEAYNDESNKRVKIDLTSQRNEVMSSSGNLAHQMKQKIVEKDLHKQVAGGCWTRLASRRKKDWPF